MGDRRYQVLSLDEVERYPAMSGAPVLLPLRRRLGLRGFGLNCWSAPVGAAVIERHSEPDGDEEVYVVVRGRACFEVDGDRFEAGPATIVYVSPGTLREAVALDPETLVLAVGGRPGEAFEPKSWEEAQIEFAQARASGLEEARATLYERLERSPEAWQPAYNAASFETLAGNADAAFELLTRTLNLGPPRVRRLVAESEDFASLHRDPRWQHVIDAAGHTTDPRERRTTD